MTRFKIRSGVCVMLLMSLVLAACSGTSDAKTGSSKSGSGKPMDVLRWAGPGPVVTLDGAKAGDATSMNGIYLTSGQLTRFNPDRKPVLDLAQEVKLSTDGLHATVTLLPDLKYSDGTPILAADIEYAVDRNRNGTGAAFIATIKSVDVIDERTATVNLNGPDPDLLSWFAERAFQLHPKSLIESDKDYWSHPVSGGPYMVDKGWTPGSPKFRAVENPNYHKGPMMAKAIEIVSVPDVASRILQLTSGKLDAAVDLTLSSIKSFPADVRMTHAGVGGSNYLIANEKPGSPFTNVKVRQAMSLAIDRKEISEKAFFGLQPASTSPMFGCGDLCEPGLLPEGGARDLDAARALMKEAGYAVGFDADLKVSNSRGGWQEAAVIIADNLSDIGIKANVTPVDEGQHYSSITQRKYELFFTGGGGHPQAALSQMLNKGDFWVAATGWTPPPAAAEILQRTASTLDPEKRRVAYTDAQKLWADNAHVISVVERVSLNGSRVPDGIFVPQIKNDQKVIIQTVAEAKKGARAGDL